MSQLPTSNTSNQVDSTGDGATRPRNASVSTRARAESLTSRFLESSIPVGMWQATGNALAQAPTPLEIRRGSYGRTGWDGPLQRRNSTVSEESTQRLSRQSSAQSPASLTRSHTNPLEPHPETANEGSAFPKMGRIGGNSGEFRSEPTKSLAGKTSYAGATNDDDDPFSKFVGRGRIDDQSFTPRSKAAPSKQVDPLAEDAIDVDGDSLDSLDPRPKKRLSALPKKFLDPSEAIPLPSANEKTSPGAAAPTRISTSSTPSKDPVTGPNAEGVYPNGYKFPPQHTWGEATVIGLKAFWRFTITPLGFLVVIYGLNVVAWGGMLFLLLIGGGSQYMCYPVAAPPGYKDCNDINAPRRIWIEIDSQVLNSLFCVTGFGLVPWRFRDLYYLLQFRLAKKQAYLRKLAGIHKDWFRLPGSHELPADRDFAVEDPETNPAVALPITKNPDPPLTGVRAPATALWRLDYVIWAYVLNTFLQVVLSVFMWGFNRYQRPSWSTGLFVALACIVAALGGLMCFLEGKRVKKVEGIAVDEAEMLGDIERGEGGGRVVKGEKRVAKEEKEKGEGKSGFWGGRKGKGKGKRVDELRTSTAGVVVQS